MRNVLVVALGDAVYALDLRWVREIFTLGNMTSVPTAPVVIAGVVNYKGAIVPVLHGRRLLGAPGRRGPMPGDALVLLDVEGTRAALAVDRIDAVTTLQAGATGGLIDASGRPTTFVDPPGLIAAARALVEGTKDAGDGGHGARP
jgi:chemotaxis signal transduction protein